jgi:hypothetical protein
MPGSSGAPSALGLLVGGRHERLNLFYLIRTRPRSRRRCRSSLRPAPPRLAGDLRSEREHPPDDLRERRGSPRRGRDLGGHHSNAVPIVVERAIPTSMPAFGAGHESAAARSVDLVVLRRRPSSTCSCRRQPGDDASLRQHLPSGGKPGRTGACTAGTSESTKRIRRAIQPDDARRPTRAGAGRAGDVVVGLPRPGRGHNSRSVRTGEKCLAEARRVAVSQQTYVLVPTPPTPPAAFR